MAIHQENLIEVTVWFRGVVEGRLARKIVNTLASAAAQEGKFMQAFDNYADAPDRVDVPCRSYARLCPEPIAEPYIYENHHPSVVVATDAALVKGCDVLKGMEPDGVLVVNTSREPTEILKLLEGLENRSRLKTVATIDAGEGARPRAPYGAGGEGAVDRPVDPGPGAPILGAIARASGVVKLESLLAVETDKAGLQKGCDQVKMLTNPVYRPEERKVESPIPHLGHKVDLIIPAPSPNGENEGFITSNFRQWRPIFDEDKCTLCRLCWISCPDSCIRISPEESPKIAIDLKYCKGCGICWSVCPVPGALRPEDELNFEGGMVRLTYTG
ncbi:MAG: 4Fe-4S binding protein [Chloroflexi bacterium]|nr:4Fe-4S binding protein [Chloroflexota bacterium]MCL5074079.1 4Fe-4S binding protein [Chloroflexota bacterium]